MKTKNLFLAGVLAIFTLSIAAAKTYDITLSSPVKAGSVQLKAGDYKIAIDGTKVTFTNSRTKESLTTTKARLRTSPSPTIATRTDTTTEGSHHGT